MENSNSQEVFNDGNPVSKMRRLDILAHIPTEVDQNDLYYSMKKEDRGRAIIFSHEFFDEIDGYSAEPRHGTVTDVEELSSTFSGLGFKIDLQENRTYKQIKNHISKVSRMDELKNYDCLVVFVLTHGVECEVIYAKDRNYCVKELVEPFTGVNCLQLANKPKLFFIQACKGTKLQAGIPLRTLTDHGLVRGASKTCVMYNIPEISDILVAYATIEGYVALRDPAWGSPYIKCLCEELRSCGTKEDLLTILIRVHKRLSIAVYSIRDKDQLVKVQDKNQLVKVQPSFLCYLNRFVRFDAPSFRPQTQ